MSYLSENPVVLNTSSNVAAIQQTSGLVEAATQSYKAGELVYKDGTNDVKVCGADPTKILGMAAADASGTTGTAVKVNVIQEGDLVRMQVSGDGAARSTSADVEEYTLYGIVNISNVWHVDVSDTTNTRVMVVQKAQDVAENNQSYCYVRFIPEYLQFTPGTIDT